MTDTNKVIWEKMSKSRGNVIRPEEVVWGISDIDPKYEFRDLMNDVIDYKQFGVWRDNLDTGCYFTSTKYKREPVFLCEVGDPVPLKIVWFKYRYLEEEGKNRDDFLEIFQHEHLLEIEHVWYYAYKGINYE